MIIIATQRCMHVGVWWGVHVHKDGTRVLQHHAPAVVTQPDQNMRCECAGNHGARLWASMWTTCMNGSTYISSANGLHRQCYEKYEVKQSSQPPWKAVDMKIVQMTCRSRSKLVSAEFDAVEGCGAD